MAHVYGEAISAVSASIALAGDGDLLTTIRSSELKWQSELDEAKSMARSLLATVLSEREALRTSLGTAADLWRTLRPSDNSVVTVQPHAETESPSESTFIASELQLGAVQALQNVSHTLFLTEFILSAPEALEKAHSSLTKIRDDGLEKVVPGNAALLVEAHSILTAGERLRNLVILDAPDQFCDELSPLQSFSSTKDIRDLLNEIIMQGVFSKVIEISQQNPRLLVAAARVVECDEREATWWKTYLVKYDDSARHSELFSSEGHLSQERAGEAIVKSLRSQFRRKELELGLTEERSKAAAIMTTQQSSLSLVSLEDILEWIKYRRSENETVRRFVVPCLPPSFAVSAVFEQEFRREFMNIIKQVLHRVTPDGSMMLSESEIVQLTSWYSSYKHQIDDYDEDIDSFLEDPDRERLISALQKHCSARISSKISAAFAADMSASSRSQDPSAQAEKEGTSAHRVSPSLRHTDMPDIVLGCVHNEVRRILALKINGLDIAMAKTVAECLTAFQDNVQESLLSFVDTEEEKYRLHACRTANNMARCLELSENLRGLFVPIGGDQESTDIEDLIDRVVEGFRSTSSRALQMLVRGMTSNIESLASRFFAPHTGTEIMLDVIATMEDCFNDYELFLVDYHLEHLAIESLKRIIVWYLSPFLRLSNLKIDESVARRFTSLPTFDEMNLNAERADIYEEHVFTMRTDIYSKEKPKRDGLGGMNGSAVVAQLDKDIANLTTFIEKKVLSFQKKQLQPVLEPLQMIRSMYTCPATPFSLVDTFREASIVIGRALRPSWAMECGLEGRFNVRVAEMMWCSRTEVNPIVRLDAINTLRATAERMEPGSQSRMSSFDDGRLWGSRHSDYGGTSSEQLVRKDGRSGDNTESSSSLLWAPSVSRSSRSRSRGL